MCKIQINKCDNEIVGIISTHLDSYVLFDIKSGYNNSVDVEINLAEGNYGGVQTFNGLSGPLNKNAIINVPQLPPGQKYRLAIIGIDWGGAENFEGSIDGVNFQSSGHPNTVQELAYQDVTI